METSTIMLITEVVFVCWFIFCRKSPTPSKTTIPKNTCPPDVGVSVGKGFSTYYSPQKCNNSKDCYPGMYIGSEFNHNMKQI